MFLEFKIAKTMHLSAKNASRAPEGCHPCNLSIRATWGPFWGSREIAPNPQGDPPGEEPRGILEVVASNRTKSYSD